MTEKAFSKRKKVLSLKQLSSVEHPNGPGVLMLPAQLHGSLSKTRYSRSRMTLVPAIPAPCGTSC